MKKYYLSLLMAIMAIAVSAQEPWDGTSASWTNGDGSSEKPYLIENGQHLAFPVPGLRLRRCNLFDSLSDFCGAHRLDRRNR